MASFVLGEDLPLRVAEHCNEALGAEDGVSLRLGIAGEKTSICGGKSKFMVSDFATNLAIC